MAGSGIQACSRALGAGLAAQEFRQFLAHHARIGFAIAAFEVGQDAFEGVLAADARAVAGDVAELDDFLATAVEQDVPDAFRQFAVGLLAVELVVLRQALQHGKVPGIAPVPAADRAAGQAQIRIAHHALGIEELLDAKTVAARAGTGRIVEGEQPRLEFGNAEAAHRAGEAVGKQHFGWRVRGVRIHRCHADYAIGQLQRGFERLGEALLDVLAHLETVDDDFDGVLAAQVELGRVVEFADRAIDPRAHVALGAQFRQQLHVLALARLHHRGEQHEPRAFGQCQRLVHHLADGLRQQVAAVGRAARGAGTGVQQAQVVVDLGDRADRGARVVRGGLLFDRDGRRQALDVVHVGLVHHRQELSGIGRQGFHVAALALGIDRVESQRGLAGAGQAGDHDQPVPGQVQVQVLEVVGPRAADTDVLHLLKGQGQAEVNR